MRLSLSHSRLAGQVLDSEFLCSLASPKPVVLSTRRRDGAAISELLLLGSSEHHLLVQCFTLGSAHPGVVQAQDTSPLHKLQAGR